MPEEDNPQGGNQAEALQKLLDKKNGDAMGVAMMLLSENFSLREKNRGLKEKVPAEGAAVLTKEEAEEFVAFKALNLKVADIKTKVETFDTVADERDGLKKVELLRQVASAGYDFDTLQTFDELEGKDVEYVPKDTQEKDGKTVKTWSVKVGGTEKPLEDYVKEKRPALASILKSEGSAQGGTPFPRQSAGGTPAKAEDPIEKRNQEREKARETNPNPLMQKPTAPGAAAAR